MRSIKNAFVGEENHRSVGILGSKNKVTDFFLPFLNMSISSPKVKMLAKSLNDDESVDENSCSIRSNLREGF